MIEFLSQNPLLLLFIVAAVGYFLGNISYRGSALGVAAILFTGLFFGALDPSIQIPEIILVLGLSLFVYSIGLSSGPAFFKSYRKNGLRDITFILSMLAFSGIVAVGLWAILGFSAAAITGIYAGSTTNTPALASIIDYINISFEGEQKAKMLEEVVVGYTFSYPMGVIGGMIAIVLMERFLKIDYKKEEQSLKREYPIAEDLSAVTVRITNEELCGRSLRDLFREHKWNVVFGRVLQDNELKLSNWDVVFSPGDKAMLVGNKDEVEAVISVLGVKEKSKLSYDRTRFDVRRIFLSNSKLAGRTIASLNLHEKYNTIITRIRRGDVDMLATGQTILELGDRIRFIAQRDDLRELSTYFGDSYRESSKVNLFSFGLGISLGLILGSITFNLGPAFSFKLGYAGGPLIVGLLLGALRRTGPVLWTLPYSANVTIQQIGLIFLLAAIGVRSGNAFIQSISVEGLWFFLASGVISMLTAIVILLVGYKVAKRPFGILLGVVANQPAILEFATRRSQNSLPEFGYAMMFPIALISKVLIAQILFLLLT